jgi:hypothetical protein
MGLFVQGRSLLGQKRSYGKPYTMLKDAEGDFEGFLRIALAATPIKSAPWLQTSRDPGE